MSPLSRLLRPAGREWRWLALTLALAFLALAAGLGLLALSGWFISAAALAGVAATRLDVFTPGAGIRAFAVTRTVARYGERLVAHEAVFRQLARLRVDAFARLLRLDAGRLHAMRRGDALTRLTADVELLEGVFLRWIVPTVTAIALTLLAALVLGVIAPELALAGAGAMLVGGLGVLAALDRAGRAPGRALAAATPALRARIAETLRGRWELRSLGLQEQALADAGQAGETQIRHQVRLRLIETAGRTVLNLLGLTAAWAVLWLALGAWDAGRLSPPLVLAALLTMLAVAEAWPSLAAGWSRLEATRRAAARIAALDDNAPAATGTGLPDPGAGIKLTGVAFRYQGAAEALLEGIDLDLAAGARVTITGPSGSGKSTLGRIAAGLLQPASGGVAIGGEDPKQLDPDALHAAVGYLPQAPVLFQDTLAANLRLARPDAPDADLRRALDTVGLAEFVDRLPRGLNAWIGESGFNVSGGEARRLALARLILGDFPILVLDEPGQGLDAPTAARLRESLEPWLHGRSVLVLSHDPQFLPGSRHLRLERGRLHPAG